MQCVFIELEYNIISPITTNIIVHNIVYIIYIIPIWVWHIERQKTYRGEIEAP